MIGTSASARVVAHVRGDLVAVHARHLDVEQDHVRNVLLQQRHRLDAVLRREHAHAVALEQALRDASHRDRIVHHHARRCGRRAPSAPRSAARARHSERTSVPMSRIMTMRPSPRIVAPEMPRMPAICGPTGFTTISRLPISSSVTSAVECSPARTRMTGSGDVRLRQDRRPAADERAEVLEAVASAAVIERRGLLVEVALDLGPREARHALDRRHRQREQLVVHAHDQRLRDRERERQADREARADAAASIR